MECFIKKTTISTQLGARTHNAEPLYRAPSVLFFTKAYQIGIMKVENRIFVSALRRSTLVLCDLCVKIFVASVVNFHNERALSSSLLFSSVLLLLFSRKGAKPRQIYIYAETQRSHLCV